VRPASPSSSAAPPSASPSSSPPPRSPSSRPKPEPLPLPLHPPPTTASQQNPAGNILVLGDFNAQENEESFKILERGNPSIGVAPLTDLLPGLGRQNPKTTTHSSGRAIDHILFGSNLAGEILPDTAFVLGTMDRPAGANWRTTPPPPGYASDHYPVSVDILPINKPAAAATPATPTPAPAPANPK